MIFVFSAFVLAVENYVTHYQQADDDQITEIATTSSEQTTNSLSPKKNNTIETIKVPVQTGQNIGSILKTYHFCEKDIAKISNAITKNSKKFALKPSHRLKITGLFSDEQSQLKMMRICIDPESEIVIEEDENEEFKAHTRKIKLAKKTKYISGMLNTNFYSTLKTNGVSSNIIRTAAVNLGYVINFQHDIKKGDTYKFLYEVYLDEDGEEVKNGNILYMSINAKGKDYELYGFNRSSKTFEYFSSTGESVVRGFLQTPLDARRVRISSGFTLKGRMHPIKGYCRAHKGVDFAAHTGTPVIAAADGIITQSGYNGDYGNKVTIKHSGGYQTVYAHLHRIKVRKGQRVKQREIIGTVGTTGLSTGPHLHFELISHGQHINPMSFKLIPSERLSGNEFSTFKRYISAIQTDIIEQQKQPTISETLRA